MSIDRHRLLCEYDGEMFTFTVECPYDMERDDRPCWPWEEGGLVKCAEPQPDCTYKSWVESLGVGDLNVSPFAVALPIVAVVWEGGYPAFKVGSPYAYHDPTNQLTEGE